MLKIIYLVLLSQFALSDESQTLQTFQVFQDYAKSMSIEVNDPLCEKCNEEQLVSACIRNICSNSQTTNMYFGGGGGFPMADPNLQKLLGSRTEMEQMFKKLFSADLEVALHENESRLEILNSDQFTSNEELFRLIAAIPLLSADEKARAKFPASIQAISNQISNLFRTIATSSEMAKLLSNPEEYFNQKYSGLSIDEAIKREIKEIAQEEERMLALPILENAKALTDTLPKFDETALYKRVKEGKSVSSHELKMILEHRFHLNLTAKFFAHSETENAISSINLDELKSFSTSPLIKENLMRLIASLKENGEELVSQISTYCVNNILAETLQMATDEDLKRLPDLLKNAKKSFKSNVISRLSGVSKAKLEAKLDTWRFEFQTPSTSKEILYTSLDNETDVTQLELNKIKRLSLDQKRDYFSDTISAINIPESEEELFDYHLSEIFDSFEDLCVTTATDHAKPVLGLINISGTSIKNSKDAQGILGHEMGHLLEHELKAKTLSNESQEIYSKVASCLADKHGSSNHVGEDFADTVGALMREKDHGNFNCIELSMAHEELFTFHELHSSTFFRLLHVEKISKEKMDPICQRASSSKKLKDTYDNCWPKGLK